MAMTNYKKIYLAGPMKGIVDSNRPEFRRMARKISSRGYKVYNPSKIPLKLGYAGCMRICILELAKCGAVALL